ncbi:MAG: type III pantothenate kinase [Planctomycetota bacterium]
MSDDPATNQGQFELTPPPGRIVAVSVGNTTAAFGLIEGLSVSKHANRASDEPKASAAVVSAIVSESEDTPPDAVLLASVNDAHAEPIAAAIAGATGLHVERFGPSLPVPIATNLAEPGKVGQDRLLAALGAFATVQQACIVVDAGTALTVDFVDGTGVFHGGAIIPGGQMMLAALHHSTGALPQLALADMPDPLEPFGTSTEHAMFLGVRAAIRGSVRYLAERYAEYYDAYPQIIATGGDAPTLLVGDELIEHTVPDLVLQGIAAARARYAAGDDADSSA